MKTRFPKTPTSRNAVNIVAALLSIGVTSGVCALWELKAGAAAIAAYVLIGFPTYKLCVLGYGWLRTLRQTRVP